MAKQGRRRKRLVGAVGLALWVMAAGPVWGQALPYQDTKLPVEKRVEDLVGRMTLEEKVEQMMNAAPAIPRLEVPAYDYWSEGLHGIARSGYATMFPQAIGMAATFDDELVGRMGETVGVEARAKYNQAMRDGIHARYFGLTVWSPNINIFRDPRWGRGQETYGEDPYLTSRMGMAFVRGLQGPDPREPLAIATPKHFAVHSGPESERHRFDVMPSAHDLEDTYLPAFRATVTEAHADSLMCAYNRVDGVPACANTMLLRDTLRGAWGFRGFVTSDCGAVDDFFMAEGHHFSPDAAHASASAVLAGTDTNCGNTYQALGEAVRKGLVPESAIHVAVARLMTARFELGLFDGDQYGEGVGRYGKVPFSEVNSTEHRRLALRAARESIVLLKNDGVLPFKAGGVKRIAVIGPNAASLTALEGNYNATPFNPVLPVDALKEEFPDAEVTYAQGSPYAEGVMLPVPRTVFHPPAMLEGAMGGGEVFGLTGEYFENADFSGKPAVVRKDKQIDFDWDGAAPLPVLKGSAFGVRWSGMMTVPAAGDYQVGFTLGDCYPCRDNEEVALFLDGKEVKRLQSHEPGEGRDADLPPFMVHFADTKEHALRVEYAHKAGLFGAGLTMNWLPPVTALRAQAVAAARRADLVVAFVGLSSKLEGEEMPVHVEGFAGGDRTDIKLPRAQEAMLEAVAATGKPLVVVLMNGSALAVQWAQEHANAILEGWYPGESGGQAIAETLSGKNNPGGRLPLTFYASVDQLPPFTDYRMKGRTYRYFAGKPLYRFGSGLSYTTFAYADVTLSAGRLAAGESMTVQVSVTNTGKRDGDEVAQVYLAPPQDGVAPRWELAGFKRVHLKAGERTRVEFTLDARVLSQVDEEGSRKVKAGEYRIFVKGGQPEAGTSEGARFVVAGEKVLAR